ncbi:MAG TPA: SPOR domain-containing protein [Methylomirabilota bacterium]|nr:SPOR domain-containing protein [Methylomirabilota bacterium]
MSPERPEQDDDFLEDEEQDEYEGQRSIFATGWFRAVLVLLVLAVIAVIAVPLIGGWFEPTPPPKVATPAPTPRPSEPAPTPSAPTPPAPAATTAAPATPAPVTPPATPTPPSVATPAPTPAPARPEAPAATPPPRAPEKKAPDRTAALTPSKSESGKAPAPGAGRYWVQVGAFKESRNAEGLAKALRSEGFPVQVTQVRRDTPLHVVRVGGYPDRSRATAAREDLQGKGHTGFVTSGPVK